MNAIILAAGYATRLRPLTETWAKELLPVGGRPIIDRIVDSLSAVDEIEAVHVVTNSRKAAGFHAWAEGRDVIVHDDGTTSNEDRLGAIGDMQYVIDAAGLDDDLLVIAGDNLFDFSLPDFVSFWRSKGRASAVAVRDVGSLELAAQYGIVALDDDARVTAFVEKPADPQSTLAAIATYLFHREHAALIRGYLAEGQPADQPGRFAAWLQQEEPVYGWVFDSTWYDIGNHEQLLEADNRMRVEAGLPERATYFPE
ncbi:MAG: glucose-phosphate thymidylyltransferase [Gaiellaceae bacterium]|nr:glucose-phosphate thymidylyltransferase [Gaiellaceae bacterium]